jgi:hypothetical protein
VKYLSGSSLHLLARLFWVISCGNRGKIKQFGG